jgi:hypothetical protein
MSEKWEQLRIDRQMADFERSMPGSTKHERKILKRALEIFGGTLEMVPDDISKQNTTHDQPELNTRLFADLARVERIL